MTDYVKSTNFTSKDSLSSGNPSKIVKGTEFDTEFNNIATAIATKADVANAELAGTPTAPTASAGTNTSQIATTAFTGNAITAERTATATLTNKSLTSPTLTGTPTAPTASVNTNTTQVATTAFVVAQVADDAPTKTGTGATGTWDIDITGNAATSSVVSTITTEQVLGALAGLSQGAVGTYSVAWNNTTSGVSANSTIAGSNLRYPTSGTAPIFWPVSTSSSTTAPGSALSGTWKNMGGFCSGRTSSGTGGDGDPITYSWYPSLWLRTE